MLSSAANQNEAPISESGKLIDVLKFQAKHNPNVPYLKYFDQELITLSFSQVYAKVNTASSILKSQIQDKVRLNSDGYATVAYWANSTQNYALNFLSLINLDLVPVVLSPKNPIDIQLHLIKESGSTVLVYDKAYEKEALECQTKLDGLTIVEQQQINTIQETYEEVKPFVKIVPKTQDYKLNILMILHSSGTTSVPKLIQIPNQGIFRCAEVGATLILPQNLAGNGLLIAPLYHVFGIGHFCVKIITGSCLSIPTLTSLSAAQILKDIQYFNCNYMLLVPFVIKALFEYCSVNKSYWKILSNLTCIFTGGALLPKPLQIESIEYGVNIINGYGSSESGFLATNIQTTDETKMDYLRLVDKVDYELINVQDDVCQILIHKQYSGLASGLVKEGEKGYVISDLFRIIEYQPEKEIFIFQILGRQDDTIIHLNGEKTNPLPIEGEIISNPYVKNCLVYGTNKLYNCLIVELNQDAKSIPLFKLSNSILQQVEKANIQNPSHSRIFPELIYVLPLDSSKTFITTAKGSMVRKKNEVLFEDEINQLYVNFDTIQSRDSGISEDSDCSIESITNLFYKVTGKQINNGSFFKNGMDSLSVVRFRNLILSKYPKVELTINNIYENDNIETLVGFINNNTKKHTSIKTLKEYQYQVDQIIKKYTNFTKEGLKESKPKKTQSLNVLITGANGSLGNFIIQELLQRTEINHIYALSRATTSEESLQRLKLGFESRLIKLNSEQWSKITALPYQIDDDKLGLDDIIYSKIKDEVDVIYHNAWTMDFLKGVLMFEDCIKGTVNLLNISAYNQSSFHFVSSVGASMPVNTNLSLKEEVLNTELKNVDTCNGYNLSKLITETIALKYSKNYNFNLNIHRVGQISGDSINGAWNVREYLPLLIKGIQVMKVAPKSFMNISWIPVDYAARGMVEVNFNEGSNINHIVNPKVFSFDVILDALKSYGFEFEIIENEKFIKILKKQEYQNVDINPIASLTDFFTKSLHNTSYSLVMETKQTELRADAIKNCPPIDQALLFKYIEFWKASKFIN